MSVYKISNRVCSIFMRGLLALLLALSISASAQAACSTSQGKAVLNEYYFGNSNPPGNFLEVYSGDPAFTAATWQSWSIDVYSALNTKTSYTLTSGPANIQACVFGSQTYVTYGVAGGLVSSSALVVLRDAGGSPIDAFVFDNNNNAPAPWPAAAISYYPALASECPSLSNKLNAQELLYSTTPSQMNMLRIANYGNQDLARFPDGTGVWDVSSNQGAGTTFSQCSPNNPTLTKTSNVATVLPGGSVVYTVKLTNGGKTPVTVVVSDPIPSNWTYATTVTAGTFTVTGQTITWNVGTVAAGAAATMTVTATVPVGTTGGVYTNNATSTAGITPAISASAPVTVIYPLPTITGITPASANVGAAGFTMTVNGTNFVPASVAYFGATALVTTYVNATQLSVAVPAGVLTTAGTFNVTVVNPAINTLGGGTSNAMPFTVGTPVGSFNAFETATAVGAISGNIQTKIAGNAFSLDVVALSGTAQATGFTSAVKVELLGNTVTGVALDAQNCPVTSTVLQTVAPNPTITGGRSAVSFAAVADAWKDVRVRISYPAAAPTVIACSTDNFAIRPGSLASVGVTDQDWQTAGAARTLNNTGAVGGNVHKAGQPFTVSAIAVNAVGATTTNYTGTPISLLTACAGTACTAALAAPPVVAAAVAGAINSTSSYGEVGAFTMQLQDQTFANADAADSTTAQRYITSAAISVGRFVPDHFTLSAPSIASRADIPCAASPFTYMGESLNALFTLTAQAAGGGITQNYSGALAKLNPAAAGNPLAFGAVDSTATPTYLSARLDTNLPATGNFANGMAAISAPLGIARGAAADGPYAALDIGIAPKDSDGVVMSAYDLDTDTTIIGSDHTKVARTEVRYGQLKIASALGSELLQLPIAITAQYWNGSSYATNSADSCTRLNAATVSSASWTNITPANWQPLSAASTWAAGATSVVPATASMTFASGLSGFTLAAPGQNKSGSVNLTVNAPTWLLNSANNARATFGVYKGIDVFIYQRENY